MGLDAKKIHELIELDDDGSNSVLKELAGIFLSSTPPKIKKIIESFYLKDLPSLKREAHSLRSSSLAVGAEVLAQLASEIEYVQDNEGIEEFLRERIKKLNPEFNTVKAELSVYL